MTMPAGKYYIGDLCYVMHPEWDECCELFFPAGGHPPRGMEGEFTLKDGRRFASFSTAHGDGTYHANIGTSHSVDSGSIGCIRVEDVRDSNINNIRDLGAIVEFPEPFEVSSAAGMLVFGHVKIETDFAYYEDEDEDEEEHDCFSDEE